MIEAWLVDRDVEYGILHESSVVSIDTDYALAVNEAGELIVVYVDAPQPFLSHMNTSLYACYKDNASESVNLHEV